MEQLRYAVNPDEAIELIIKAMAVGLPVMTHGSPGVGKSHIYAAIAKRFNLELIDIRLSQTDPLDLNGMLAMSPDKTKGTYVPLEMWPLEGDPLPPGKNGWLILLDEINSAPLLTQAAAYKTVYDKMVGMKHLHKNVAMGAAGNLITDKAIVNRLSTAMQTRMLHLLIKVDQVQWSTWASKNGIVPEVISYLNFAPDMLHQMSPDNDDFTFPCPRTWEFTSDLIKKHGYRGVDLPLLVGTVGAGAANGFQVFAEVYQHVPTKAQILNDPKNTPVPQKRAAQAAISGMVGGFIDDKTIQPVMQYIDRMGMEFQTFALRDAIARIPQLINNPLIDAWMTTNAVNFA